jgi:hypothetical protein
MGVLVKIETLFDTTRSEQFCPFSASDKDVAQVPGIGHGRPHPGTMDGLRTHED